MRMLFAAATAAVATSLTGCYGPMHQPPYGYSAPGAYGGYPGSMNTLTPGPTYVPGGTMAPGGSIPPTYGAPGQYIPPAGGGSAPTFNNGYSPGVGPSAGRPAPTYADPGADAGGGSELGMYNSPVLQRASGQTYAPPQPMPPNTATPLAGGNEFSVPTATGGGEFGGSGDASFQKVVLPYNPGYMPVSAGQAYRTPAY